ncbi:hypothetical protein [Streptomyces sp. NPDC057302]|uniref:hypothetical protein n=1 Tax=Streptomyces sp. NPDC057302 TaxID=3346094 RepID=UPI00363B4977
MTTAGTGGVGPGAGSRKRDPAPGPELLWARGGEAGEILDAVLYAAAGFPAILFSAALPVVLGFWLLVALGGADAESFDADVDAGAVGLGGVPVAVAASLLIVTGWCASLTGSVLLDRTAFTGLAHAVADVVLLFLSVLVAWCVTRHLLRPLARRPT